MDDPVETKAAPASISIPPERLEEIKKLLSGAKNETPDPSGGIASVLNNPELMAKLPQIMETVKPLLTGLSPALPPAEPKRLSREEERDRLLLSLRPFLSKERQDLVEAILKLSKLGEVLKHLS